MQAAKVPKGMADGDRQWPDGCDCGPVATDVVADEARHVYDQLRPKTGKPPIAWIDESQIRVGVHIDIEFTATIGRASITSRPLSPPRGLFLTDMTARSDLFRSDL